MYSLTVQTGKHKGKTIALPDREVTIGRDVGCFVRMTSAEVSRLHCALIPTDKGLLVRDLESQNGSIVNNVRIEGETLLQPGDFLQVGPVQFQMTGPPPATAQPGTESELSDQDIFSWLSDAGEGDTATEIPSVSDTTVVKASELHPVARPAPPKPTFKTVGEEARDIIRRHKESLGETA
jgi:pSer/pThr/pTyr-binding forkhead associated (FHA) protein